MISRATSNPAGADTEGMGLFTARGSEILKQLWGGAFFFPVTFSIDSLCAE